MQNNNEKYLFINFSTRVFGSRPYLIEIAVRKCAIYQFNTIDIFRDIPEDITMHR
jgi:hypothetical protein